MKTRLLELSRGPNDRVVDLDRPLARLAGTWPARAKRAAVVASYQKNEHSGRLEMVWATPPEQAYERAVSNGRSKRRWQPDEPSSPHVRVVALVD